MLISPLLVLFAAIASSNAGAVLAERDAEPIILATRQTTPPPAGCLNSESRLCWDGEFDITTNYYESGPRTGRTVTYTLDIQNVTLAPDGHSRQVLAINGQIPGPNIVANWGDRLEIRVRNSMQHNGTSIHWHGIRMFRNFLNDGVNGVTECPIAPGDEKVYSFIAEQYGTSWYHSHYSAQYGDGVWGTLQINGPATAEYDIDLGPISLTDWFWRTAFEAAYSAERGGPPPTQNFLVNGLNVNPLDTTQGQRAKFVFTPGKKHRLRFINTSTDTFFRVSLDGHSMTVIQTDFVPIVPYTAQHIGIAIGQRYDVIIEANQPNATYWLRTWPQPCSARNANTGTGTANAYIQYDGATDALPTSTPVAFTASCNDEQSLVPYVPITLDSSGFPGNRTSMPVSGPTRVNTTGGNVFRWSIMNPIPMDVDFSNPSVKLLKESIAMPAAMNSISVEGGGANTAYWVIQNMAGVAHPLHWHLHDGFLVSQGAGTFNASTAVLKWDNPPRRDVVMLPGSGYVVLAFKTDNPGIGILHCHIAWHVSEGLSLQFVERASEIFDFTNLDSDWNSTCAKWDAWYTSAANPYGPKTDSGLRKI